MSSIIDVGPKNMDGVAFARSFFGTIAIIPVLEAWE
jgi:hypothetical protein